MNAKQDTAELRKGRADVLSTDEEAVLAEIREIARRVKDESGTADLHTLGGRVDEAGASIVDSGRDGIIEFRRGKVRFLIRSVSGDRFEINFPAQEP